MNVRAFEIDRDYEMVAAWWAARSLPAVPKILLRIARGVVVCGGTADIAVGWMYFDETRTLGVVDWITTNPSAPVRTVTDAIARVLGFFDYAAKDAGCHNLISFVAKDTGLHRFMVNNGWQDPQSSAHVYLFKSWP